MVGLTSLLGLVARLLADGWRLVEGWLALLGGLGYGMWRARMMFSSSCPDGQVATGRRSSGQSSVDICWRLGRWFGLGLGGVDWCVGDDGGGGGRLVWGVGDDGVGWRIGVDDGRLSWLGVDGDCLGCGLGDDGDILGCSVGDDVRCLG